jgi:hypothetical protein
MRKVWKARRRSAPKFRFPSFFSFATNRNKKNKSREELKRKVLRISRGVVLSVQSGRRAKGREEREEEKSHLFLLRRASV